MKDLKGVVAVSNQYCTIEKFVEAYCDLHIYKIGSRYKAVMCVLSHYVINRFFIT